MNSKSLAIFCLSWTILPDCFLQLTSAEIQLRPFPCLLDPFRKLPMTADYHLSLFSLFRMENLAKLASKEHGQIEELERQFQLSHQAQVANMQWMVHALAFVANRQTVMAGMDFTLTLMHSAITDLSQGILSDHLVSEKDFRALFEELDKVKQGMGNDFHFMVENQRQFHVGSSTFAFVNGSDLWITVKIPVGIMKPLHLYRVHSWSTPVYAKSQHATIIQDLPEYMVVSQGMAKVGFLTLDQLQSCSMGEIISCPFMLPLRERYGPHCIDNLFRGVEKYIMETCTFAFEANVIAPLLLPVGQGKVLFQNIRTVTVRCGKDRRTMRGCNSCLMQLPCNCVVKAHPYEVVTSSVGRCSGLGQARHVTKHHMVNFAVLRTFEKEEDALLQELRAGALFDNKFALSEKKFKALDRQIEQITDHGAVLKGKLKVLEKQASQLANESEALASTMLTTWTTSAFLQTGPGRSIAGFGSVVTVTIIAIVVGGILMLRCIQRNQRNCVFFRRLIAERLGNPSTRGNERDKKKTDEKRKRQCAPADQTFIKAVHWESNFPAEAKRRIPVNDCSGESLDCSEIDS